MDTIIFRGPPPNVNMSMVLLRQLVSKYLDHMGSFVSSANTKSKLNKANKVAGCADGLPGRRLCQPGGSSVKCFRRKKIPKLSTSIFVHVHMYWFATSCWTKPNFVILAALWNGTGGVGQYAARQDEMILILKAKWLTGFCNVQADELDFGQYGSIKRECSD